jgi:hypothetical protein
MAAPVKELAAGTSKTIGGLREIVQDLVAPDLSAVRVSIDALAQELRLRSEALSQEMKLRSENLQDELRALREEMRLRDENQSKYAQSMGQDIKDLSRKLDFTIELRVRVAVLEARLPKQ